MTGCCACVQTCYEAYSDIEFITGVDGNHDNCWWCGKPAHDTTLLCCDTCPHAFCQRCIQLNVGLVGLQRIIQAKTWSCYSCKPQSINVLKTACKAYLARAPKSLTKTPVPSAAAGGRGSSAAAPAVNSLQDPPKKRARREVDSSSESSSCTDCRPPKKHLFQIEKSEVSNSEGDSTVSSPAASPAHQDAPSAFQKSTVKSPEVSNSECHSTLSSPAASPAHQDEPSAFEMSIVKSPEALNSEDDSTLSPPAASPAHQDEPTEFRKSSVKTPGVSNSEGDSRLSSAAASPAHQDVQNVIRKSSVKTVVCNSDVDSTISSAAASPAHRDALSGDNTTPSSSAAEPEMRATWDGDTEEHEFSLPTPVGDNTVDHVSDSSATSDGLHVSTIKLEQKRLSNGVCHQSIGEASSQSRSCDENGDRHEQAVLPSSARQRKQTRPKKIASTLSFNNSDDKHSMSPLEVHSSSLSNSSEEELALRRKPSRKPTKRALFSSSGEDEFESLETGTVKSSRKSKSKAKGQTRKNPSRVLSSEESSDLSESSSSDNDVDDDGSSSRSDTAPHGSDTSNNGIYVNDSSELSGSEGEESTSSLSSDEELVVKRKAPNKRNVNTRSMTTRSKGNKVGARGTRLPPLEGKKKKKTKKNARDCVEVSSDDEEDKEENSPTRHQLRPIMAEEKLKDSTRQAVQEEEERKRRIKERLKDLEDLEESKEIVLEVDQESKKPIVTVSDYFLSVLKPHQVC